MVKIIHIASFRGNIGDVINHVGFYKSLKQYVNNDISYHQIEIRKFYKNTQILHFDKELADKVNQYDLLVIGGGGFFDVRLNESETGTTLDMSKDFIDRIHIPVLINGIGFHEYEDKVAHKQAYERFYEFFLYIKKQDNWKIFLRNDGSYKRLFKTYGSDILNHIESIPDSGFFFTDNNIVTPPLNKKKVIGFNLTNDLWDLNFTSNLTKRQFNFEIAQFIKTMLNKKCNIIFFAHTPQDLKVIYEVSMLLDEQFFREQIIIAPYRPIDYEGARQMEKYYQMCNVIIAMRFHANILALQNCIPVIGLAGHIQIEDLYKEINMENYCIHIGDPVYIECLNQKLELLLQSSEIYRKTINDRMIELKRKYINYMENIKVLIESDKNENKKH